MKTTLYRKKGKPWEFTPHPMYHRLCHITRNGTIYGLMLDEASEYKQIWIGRRIDGKWVTWEADLRAKFIRFSDGGKYEFPV